MPYLIKLVNDVFHPSPVAYDTLDAARKKAIDYSKHWEPWNVYGVYEQGTQERLVMVVFQGEAFVREE